MSTHPARGPRSGHSWLGLASFAAALLAPISSVVCLLLLVTIPNTNPPELPDPGVIALIVMAALTFAGFAALAFLLAIAAAFNRSRRRLFEWLGLGLSSAELAVVISVWLSNS